MVYSLIMSEQEYYVRKPDAENARGPFTMDKLHSLVEAGQFDKDSVFYDDKMESWRKIGDCPELCAVLFPEKKKLALRKRGEAQPAAAEAKPEVAASGNSTTDVAAKTETPPVTEAAPAVPVEEEKPDRSGIAVADILDAAEGNTEEMKLLRIQRKWRDRAVALSLPMIAFILLLSALGLAGPHWESIYAFAMQTEKVTFGSLLEHSGFAVALVDLFLALVLALAVTQFYPLLRLRLMLGLGYFGYMGFAMWMSGDILGLFGMLGVAMFSIGLYVCTLTLNFGLMLGCGIAAFVGVVTFGIIRVLPGLLAM